MLSRGAFLFVVTSLIFTTLVTIAVQLLKIDARQYRESQRRNPNLANESDDTVIIGDRNEHLFHFLQISDIHISVLNQRGLDRQNDLKKFCTQVVDTIKPKVVLATGDLTDSRTPEIFGSSQIEEEWILYAKAINETGVTAKTTWLDLRGNHDNFGVYSWNSSNNYYRIYSHEGKKHTRHYSTEVKDGSDVYTFIAADACLNPSPKRPFNFIGLLTNDDIGSLYQLGEDAIQRGSNMTIWFGHYPTSSITMPMKNLRHILTGPYLCGHFHTIGAFITKMYATHKEGALELEVGDWKDNRIYRIAAVDHGLFTFNDVKLGQWPVILVTNPKPALFAMPGYEPLHRMKHSTHIRAIVYSPNGIKTVQYRTGHGEWDTMKHVDANLYVAKWNPNAYGGGLHQLEVKAEDNMGLIQVSITKFSLDESEDNFNIGGLLLLRPSTQSFFYSVFMVLFLCSTAPIMVAYYLMKLSDVSFMTIRNHAKEGFWYRQLFKFYLLCSLNRLLFPMMMIPWYIALGPWYIGYILDDHIGAGFIWGQLVDWTIAPTALTYLFGVFKIVFVHFPITFLLAHIVYCNYLDIENGIRYRSFLSRVVAGRHMMFHFVVFYALLYSYAYCPAYGYLTLVFGFGTTWPPFIYLYLWYYTFTLTISSFPENVRPKLNHKSKNRRVSADSSYHEGYLLRTRARL